MKTSGIRILLALIAVVISIWIYNPIQLFFLNDDAVFIPRSPNLRYIYGGSFRPVSDLSLLLDINIYGTSAWGFHITNLLLHFICVVLIWLLSEKLLNRFGIASASLSFVTVILFLLYPFHSEGILWILGRGAIIAAVFFCLSLWLFLKSDDKLLPYLFSLVSFCIGLYTYESVWILPAVITALCFFIPGYFTTGRRRKSFYLIGYWALLFIYLTVKKVLVASVSGNAYNNQVFSLNNVKEYIYNYCTLFLRSFLLPTQSSAVFITLSVLIVLALGLLFLYLFKKRQFTPFRKFLWISFLLSLAPYIMFGIDTHDSESERFLYLPSIIVCMILADLITSIRYPIARKASLLVLLIYFFVVLADNSRAFKWASEIAEKSVVHVQGNKTVANKVYLVGVPTQYKGAMIFRRGVKHFFRWLAPEFRYDSLILVSEREILTRPGNYKMELKSPADAVNEKMSLPAGFSKGDIAIRWTDSAVTIIRD